MFIFFARFGLLSGHRLEKKKLLARLIICSLCTVTICNFRGLDFGSDCLYAVAKCKRTPNMFTLVRKEKKSFMYFSIYINKPRLCQGSKNKFHFKRTYTSCTDDVRVKVPSF